MSILPLLLLPALVQQSSLESRLAEIEATSKGKLGVAVITPTSNHYHRKGERFSLQSVMKLMVAMAALDQVDQGKWRPGQKFTFTRDDVSISMQPLTDRLGKKASIPVTMEECIELTVTQSCSAAGDFLIRKMGGVGMVNRFLRKKGITGLTVDRQERNLQTDVVGLPWKLAYSDNDTFEAAIKKVPPAKLDAAYKRYQLDPRDTTTPEAMGSLLKKLVKGELLSPRSTKYLMGVMERTATGQGRLKAGVPKGWKLGHKTGTSSTHRGVACATNDVGYVRNAKGDWVIIVALVRDSTAKPDDRDRTIAQVAEAALIGR